MNHNNCIANLLKFICLLQNNSTDFCLDEGCSKPFLGPNIAFECYNTRVVSFYKKDGTLFTLDYSENLESSVFRVMSVNDNTVTLLILDNSNGNYSSTNQFITINLNCICAVRCITDVLVNL